MEHTHESPRGDFTTEASDGFARAAEVLLSENFLHACSKPAMQEWCEERIMEAEEAFEAARAEQERKRQEQRQLADMIRQVQMQLVTNERLVTKFTSKSASSRSANGLYRRIKDQSSTRAAQLKARMAELIKLEQMAAAPRPAPIIDVSHEGC